MLLPPLVRRVALRLPTGTARRLTSTKAATRYEQYLKGVDVENREAVSRILEIAERAGDRWTTDASAFAYPPVIRDALHAMQGLGAVAAGIPWGGYQGAERCRLVVGHPDLIAAMESAPEESEAVVGVQIEGNFLFDAATHRDFLGSVLGSGVQRDRIGDIVVTGDRGAQVIVAPEIAGHLEMALTQVRSVPVKVRKIPLSELRVQAPKTKDISSVEASMRLDAIASAGFQMSRSKMAELIEGGDVKVNWKGILKKDWEIKGSDVISVRGKGRVIVQEVNQNKKDRFVVKMQRLV